MASHGIFSPRDIYLRVSCTHSYDNVLSGLRGRVRMLHLRLSYLYPYIHTDMCIHPVPTGSGAAHAASPIYTDTYIICIPPPERPRLMHF